MGHHGKRPAGTDRPGPRDGATTSPFSSADDAPEPGALVAFLDETARGESGMKHYAPIGREPAHRWVPNNDSAIRHRRLVRIRKILIVVEIDPGA